MAAEAGFRDLHRTWPPWTWLCALFSSYSRMPTSRQHTALLHRELPARAVRNGWNGLWPGERYRDPKMCLQHSLLPFHTLVVAVVPPFWVLVVVAWCIVIPKACLSGMLWWRAHLCAATRMTATAQSPSQDKPFCFNLAFHLARAWSVLLSNAFTEPT